MTEKEKKKQEEMKDGFDRWTSNGLGQDFGDIKWTPEQQKILDEIDKKLKEEENRELRKIFKGE